MNKNRNIATALKHGTPGMGTPLEKIDDVVWLRDAVEKLWSIIDDIDTADDMCKANDTCFRNYAMAKQKERHKVLVSDGYNLFKDK